MELQFLGPVEAWADGVRLDLGGPKPRLILALLATQPGQVVATDRLLTALWPDDGPADPRAALQVNISNLRRALAAGGAYDADEQRLVHQASGYVLRLEPTSIDLHRFASLVAEGTDLVPVDPHRAASRLRDALSLWRGRPFGDLADDSALVGEARRFEELRLRALVKRNAADLALGYHDQLVEELRSLVEAHPLREPLWGQLALAQYRCGQHAEALRTYERARRLLADELGADPSPALQDLHARIVRQDPSLDRPARPAGAGAGEEPLGMARGYALLEEAGAGRLGTRYRARQPGTGRPVTVEVIDGGMAADPAAAEELDARLGRASQLDHPALAAVEDHWRDQGSAYLVTRWVEGDPLPATLRRGPWRPAPAATLIGELAGALDEIRTAGLGPTRLSAQDVVVGDDDRPVLVNAIEAVTHQVPTDAVPDTALAARHVHDLARLSVELLTGGTASDGDAATGSAAALVTAASPELPAAVGRVLDRAMGPGAAVDFPTATAFASMFASAVTGADPDLFSVQIRNPYKGLRAFREPDRDDFFGRDGLVTQLVDELGERRLLALVGPSGSGKSSVVRAGLIPRARSGAVAGEAPWHVATMTPGEWPMAALERALATVATRDVGDLAALLASDERGLLTAGSRIVPEHEGRLLLVVDQFEEIFALARDADRDALLEQLVAAASEASSQVRVVVTLRADFYDRALLDPGLGPVIAERTIPVRPLSAEELERAVTRPADAVGLHVEPELVAAIVADVAGAPGSLPMLQYALTEVCDARDGDVLRLETYRRIGGLRGALAGRADDLYDDLDEDAKQVCRQVFLRLVAVTEGVVETRRRVLRPALTDLGPDGVVEHVLETFGRHRLLTFDRDPFSRVPTVEVAHEALTRAWGRLRGWIDAARDDLVMHRRLLAATDEWDLGGHDHSYLLRGARLEETRQWAESSSIRLTEQERAYLDESIRVHQERLEAEQRRRQREVTLERRAVRRLRGLVGALTVGIIAAIALSLLALGQRDRAQQQQAAAQQQRTLAQQQERIATARELAAASLAELDADPERSVLLAIEAIERTRQPDGTVLPEAESALHQAIRGSHVQAVHPTGGGAALAPDGTLAISGMNGELELIGPDGTPRWQRDDRPSAPLLTGAGRQIPLTFLERTTDVDFDPQGRRIATVSADLTIEVRDARSGALLVSLDRPAIRPVFSPDGQSIAAVLIDERNTVQWGAGRSLGLWDAATGQLLRRFDGHDSNVLDHAFSPDGSRLVSAAPTGGSLRLWEVASGTEIASIGRTQVKAVAFSPDGQRLVVGSGDSIAEIRDAQTLEELVTFRGHEGDLFAAAFSPDGRRVAVGGGGVELWDPATGAEIMSLAGHDFVVSDLQFTADGMGLVSSAEDGTTRVWDVSDPGGRELPTLPGPPPPNLGVLAFAPTGDLMASSSAAGLRLTEVGTWQLVRTLPVEGGAISEVVFSPDGARVAAGLFSPPPGPGTEGRLVVWDVQTGEPLLESDGHGGMIFDLAFDATGELLATGTDDEGVARVIEVASGEVRSSYRLEQGSILAVEFTSDGLFVGGQDAGLLIDPATGEQLLVFDEVDESIIDDHLVTDGSLVTGDIGGRVRLWDAATGELQRTLWQGRGGGVGAVAVAGELVASASPAGIVLTDLQSGGTRLELSTGHAGGGAFDLGLSPDGRFLATAGGDGTVRLFALSVDDLLELARSRVTRSLTDEECRRFLHVDRCE